MRLPEVADRLRTLSAKHALPELDVLASHIKRRPAVRVAEPVSVSMTDELADRIRGFVDEHPSLTQLEVGRIFNVNQGRVSEALRGKRT